jgi:hypothetical protein
MDSWQGPPVLRTTVDKGNEAGDDKMCNEPRFVEHHVPRGQGRVSARDYAGMDPAFVLMRGFPDNSHIYDDLAPHLVAGATYSFKQQLGDLKAVGHEQSRVHRWYHQGPSRGCSRRECP